MNKIRLYIYTLLALSSIVLAICCVTFYSLFRSSKIELQQTRLESGKRETRELGILLEQQLQNGTDKKTVIASLQKSIVNTDFQNEFICMYNTEGIELCHPDPAFIGKKISVNNSKLQLSGGSQTPFSTALQSGKAASGLRTFPESANRTTEIVSVYPVRGSNWMVASHSNTRVLEQQISLLFYQLLAGFLITCIAITAGSFTVIRLLYRRYENSMQHEIDDLSIKISELETLNAQLTLFQEKHEQRLSAITGTENPANNAKKRITTYQKNELISLDTSDIAVMYLEDTLVYIGTFSGKRFTTTSSLDELMKQLNDSLFYRANRQCIVNINALEKIILYGKNQLKLVLCFSVDQDIIISKNKVAEFKKWLEQ